MSDSGSNLKLLIVAKAYPPDVGGVQSYSEFIARAYRARGIEPVVVSSWEGPRGWHVRDYPEGPVRIFNTGMASQPVVLARMIVACARLRLTERFDVLHPTTWRVALAIWPFRGRTPTVLTVHGQEVLNFPAVLKSAMSGVLASADLVITVSNATMQVAKGALHGRRARGEWQVDFNGLSYLDQARAFERPARAPDAPVRILSFARLAERKNIAGCLDALAQLRDQGVTNFEYTIAGTGPLRDKIAAQIVRLGLSDRARMTGYVADEDIADLYRNADVFLHPQTASTTGRDLEGFGLAIADAISFGAAAIVGEAGGPPDFVRDGERGLVVDGNETDQIVAALRAVLTEPATRQRLARDGRAWCLENLSWQRHVDQVIAALKTRGALAVPQNEKGSGP